MFLAFQLIFLRGETDRLSGDFPSDRSSGATAARGTSSIFGELNTGDLAFNVRKTRPKIGCVRLKAVNLIKQVISPSLHLTKLSTYPGAFGHPIRLQLKLHVHSPIVIGERLSARSAVRG